ncbi:MAG TPA: hypothetical protein VM778_08650 [Gemmatimonadota bacterium]|nr:hypothetical protein [Gemmatimonadota bacterium]
MRKLLLALPLALLLATAACGSDNLLAPESSALQPADGECDPFIRPC